MKIIKLFVFTDPTQDNGIGIKKLGSWEATKCEKIYSIKGTRIPNEDFETPLSDSRISLSKLYCTIWTTEENAEQSIGKCVLKILDDFKDMDAKWSLIKVAVEKTKLKLGA